MRFAIIFLILGCNPAPATETAPEAPQPEVKAEVAPEGAPKAEAPEGDATCFKAAGVAEAELAETAHKGAYDPEKFVKECEANLKGPKAAEWTAYYGCYIEARKTTPACNKLSPPLF